MKKVYILVLVSLITSFSIFANSIELPDITTEIEGEEIKAENDSLPDFEDVLKKPHGSGSINPVLPEISEESINETVIKNSSDSVGGDNIKNSQSDSDKKDNKKKSVYSEISIAGGYPLLFQGDCSISSTDQVNPFKFLFKIDSANGYGGHSITDNFYDRNINVLFDKTIEKDNFDFNFSTEYKSVSNGLQQQSKKMANINKDDILLFGDFEYNPGNSFLFGGSLNLDLYSRYGNVVDNDLADWVKRNYILGVDPEFYVKWAGYGFGVKATAKYNGAFGPSKNIIGNNNHRGEVAFNVQWVYDFIKAFGNVSVVFGNNVGEDEKINIMVPFSVGAELSFPVYFSNRNVHIFAEGGLKSYNNSIKDNEFKYRFGALPVVPKETSFWYGKLVCDVPIKSSLSANAAVEYNKTAFDKGVWEPDYSGSSFVDGLYVIYPEEQHLLTTDFNLTYHYKIFSVQGGIHSNWFDVPALQSLHMITLNLGVHDEKSKWGINLFGNYNIEKKLTLPVINLDCFVQISPTIRITAAVNDIIPVFKDNFRLYKGIYEDRGFTAALMLNVVL